MNYRLSILQIFFLVMNDSSNFSDDLRGRGLLKGLKHVLDFRLRVSMMMKQQKN